MASRWTMSIPGIECDEQLGRGGFGEVWKARQTDLDRTVAVKIRHDLLADENDRRRFERECMALARLSGHPHIVDVYTSGVSEGRPYLVLEYIDGGTLSDLGRSMSEAQLRLVTDQLCQAVAAAHEIGVLHRDLKPENVFVDSDGKSKLGDFGIARLGDGNNTATGEVTASVAFAAPEILRGYPPTPAGDIYGIGVTVVSTILGDSPFAIGATIADEVIYAVLNESPPPLTPDGISPAFEELLFRTMAKDPAQRPASAVDLLDELRRLPTVGDNGLTTQAAPAAPFDPTAFAPPQVPSPTGQSSPAAPDLSHPSGLLPTPGVSAAVLQERPVEQTPLANAPTIARTSPSAGRKRSGLLAAAAGAVLVAVLGAGALWFMRPDPGVEVSGNADSDSTVAEQEAAPAAPVTSGTISLPLTGPDISTVTPIELDLDGLDELFGPADAPQFCDQRPTITGLTDTVAAVYPVRPTGNLRQVAQRMHRFETPEQAQEFVRSYTTFDCESWLTTEISGALSESRATLVPSTRTAGDEIAQVDLVVEPESGIPFYGRTALVRSGTDVYKLVFFTIDEAELEPMGNALLDEAIVKLKY